MLVRIGSGFEQRFDDRGIAIDAGQPQRRGPFPVSGLGIPAGATVIALTHSPDIFPSLPQSVPLLLAAHTHGGQVRLPLIGTPIVPSDFGPKYTAGHIFENGHHLFVTTGIGTSILPVRFRVVPEIVILTVKS